MPTETPASRKFRLPPSTASTSSQKHPTFAASQFIRPSQTSSSPYARTPFSSTAQKQRKDGIVADDSLSEDDEVDMINAASSRREGLSTQPSRASAKTTGGDDSVNDLNSPVPFIPTQPSQRISSKDNHIPSTKRRKLSHSVSEIIDDDPDLPSPPSSPIHSHADQQLEDPEIHIPRSSPEKPLIEDTNNKDPSSPTSSPPPSPPHNLTTPKHKHKHATSRFHTTQPSQPAPTLSTNTPHQIFPSFQSRLLASTSTSTNQNPVSTTSTSSPGPHLRGPRPSLDLTLPDAFSPSRKRGTREYIYGGVAETVRGWVVDMATRVAGGGVRSGYQQYPTTNPNEEKVGGTHTVIVDQVLLSDPNGRFVLIRAKHTNLDDAEENDGELWMLINTDPQARKMGTGGSRADSSSRLTLSGVIPGLKVAVKGGESMRWDLNLDLNVNVSLDPDLSEKAGEMAMTKCKVAVLWEVVSSTR